jgi:hypothetical protein
MICINKQLSAVPILSSTITFPSYLTLPLIIWASVSLLPSHRWFKVTARYVAVYFSAIALIQYVFNMSSLAWEVRLSACLLND